jgi:hypothetical protein
VSKQLTGRLEELSTQRRKMIDRQTAIEIELTALRTESILGRLQDTGRLDSLREQSVQLASDLREVERLKKLTLKALSESEMAATQAAKDAEVARMATARAIAVAALDDVREQLRRISVEYAATWAVAQGEKPTFAAAPSLIQGQLNLREHLAAVEYRYGELTAPEAAPTTKKIEAIH